MSINVYDFGDVIRLTGVFDTTPTTVALVLNPPSGEIVAYDYASPETTIKLGNAETNSYYADIEAAEAGTWYYEWKSTGTGQAAEQRQFVVRQTNAPEPA
jgi:hypothetical protein